MKIAELFKKKEQTFSFEFFPPKTPEGETKLFETVAELKALQPSFVSVTYGAMGTTRDNTLRIVSQIKRGLKIEAAAHLTCVGHTEQEIEKILTDLKTSGIENIVALRGDPPKGEKQFVRPAGGFAYASELVGYIRRHPDFKNSFSLIVGGYPEGHPECRDREQDLKNLKIKTDAGADAIITQLFFDNRDYFEFVECARKIGIRIPIIPGIMPVTHAAQIEKFSQMCGSKIPVEMRRDIEKLQKDPAAVEAYGIDYAVRQCRELLREGVPGLHFYTLNKSGATRRIYSNLGLVRN